MYETYRIEISRAGKRFVMNKYQNVLSNIFENLKINLSIDKITTKINIVQKITKQ